MEMRRYASLHSIRCATLNHVTVAVVVPRLCAFYNYLYMYPYQAANYCYYFSCVCMIVGVGSDENEERRGKGYEF